MNTPQRIDMDTLLAKDGSGNYLNLDKLKALSKLDASTKVEFETDSGSGHTYAVYTETLPIGVQQTLRPYANGNLVSGKLTVQSSATNTNSGTSGDIYLQGREQLSANEGSTVLTNNKDLYIGNLATQVGDIVLTSLGGIYNAANAAATTITGKNLVLTAARGSIGTDVNHITTNLLGADKNVDGISAISSGGIYADQKGSNALLVHNVSSGGDIYLGSDTSIFMGVVNGSNVENYIRAENNGAIVLEARNGSIGEVEYVKDAEGNYVRDPAGNMVVARDTNNGVRILNSAVSNTSHVALRASDSVYVTGVASEDGVTAAPQGPAGTLNLTVEGVTSNGQAVTLQNVGVSVDGELNLENAASTSQTASVYTTADLTNGVIIKSPDIFMGSVGDVVVDDSFRVDASTQLLVKAGQDVVMNSGVLGSAQLALQAGSDISLNGGSAKANEVSLTAANDLLLNGGVITANEASLTAANDVLLNIGSLTTSGKASLTATAGSIAEQNGYVLNTPLVEGRAGQTLNIGSSANKLQKVNILTVKGDVTIGSGESSTPVELTATIVGDLNIAGVVDTDLYITNRGNGGASDVVITRELQAAKSINITNAVGDTIVDGGAVKATGFIADGGLVINSGAIDAGTISATNIGIGGGTVASNTINATGVDIGNGVVNSAIVNATNINMIGGTVNSGNINATAIDISGGNVDSGTISATALNISSGHVDSENINATTIDISGGTVLGTTIGADNITMSGGTVLGESMQITTVHDMQLNGGLLQADALRLTSEQGTIKQLYGVNGGRVYAGHLYIKANKASSNVVTVDLGSQYNKLSNIFITHGTKGNIAIGSGNDVAGDLRISVLNGASGAGQLLGSLTVHNYANGAANQLLVNDNLQASGDITLINDEANIEIGTDGTGIATKLTASNITLKSKYDVVHDGGTITASDKVALFTDGNILLEGGSLSATDAEMMAVGYIDEAYRNSYTAPNGYVLSISDTLEALAGGSASDAYGVDLGSKFNQLHNVILDSDNGNIILGNGNTDAVDLNVSVQSGHVVNGNIKITNYTAGEANDVNIKTALKAKGNIDVGNEEKDVNIQADTEVDGNRVILYAARNIKNYATIASLEETNLVAFKDIKNYADIVSEKNTVLASLAGDIHNEGDIQAANNIDIDALVGNIYNHADISSQNGSIDILAGKALANLGDLSTGNGNLKLQAKEDVLNLGLMETEEGNIDIISSNGVIYNVLDADLLTGNGNVTLRAKSLEGYYYYFKDAQLVPIDAARVQKSAKGELYYLAANQQKYAVVKNGSIFNEGDILALGGTITLEAVKGNLTNYDDFNTLSVANSNTTNGSYRGKDIATGNIVFSAENGHLYNDKDLESGESISLTAAQGLTNFAYNVYAGKNITLTATTGDVVNTAVLESVYGDVKLVAEHGNVVNGIENQPSSGDIITLGGKVILQAGLSKEEAEAKHQAYDTNAYNVTNYGDIIAIGKMTDDVEGSGSIILKSEQGDVYNYDDFNTLNDTTEINYNYEASKHISIVTTNASYNIATSNIEILAEKGEIVNTRDYLVALGNVTLKAQEGIGSYGDVILAGGDITLSDTDGDLVNSANLVSVNGNITLNASNGTVVNATKGEVVALNGNVTLNAGGAIEAEHKIYLANTDNGDKTELNTIGHNVEDRIIITENYYLDDNGEKVFLSNTLLAAPNNEQIYTQVSYVDDSNTRVLIQDGITGQLEAFRAGDVVNRGDIVAQNDGTKSFADAGNVVLNSAKGNVTNYDDYKLVDNQSYYDYLGSTGYTTGSNTTAKFNAGLGSAYNDNKRFVLSDSGMELTAPEGYLYNDLALVSHQDITLESGKSLTIGTNFASVEADGDVVVKSNYGGVYNNSQVISNQGSIVLDGEIGVTSGSRDSLKALNGSISAVTTYGQINIDELIAGDTAAAGTKEAGSINIGKVAGNDVVLYTENAETTIKITESIQVEDHLLLQGNSFELPKIDRPEGASGTLIVDVNGIGQEGSGAMTGALSLDIDGDVRFTTMNVTNANVSIGGGMSIDRLHVGGEAHFTSQDYVTGVYGGGATPYHDTSNALYYDLGDGSGNTGLNMQVTADAFQAVPDEAGQLSALAKMKELKALMTQAGSAPDTFGQGDNGGWMNLYVDTANYQRSNGLLLHIDTGYRSANQRWSAEDLSGKLVDFKSHDSFVAHYGNMASFFDRFDLLEQPARPMSEVLHTANKEKVVLQQDNTGLRIEEKAEDKEE